MVDVWQSISGERKDMHDEVLSYFNLLIFVYNYYHQISSGPSLGGHRCCLFFIVCCEQHPPFACCHDHYYTILSSFFWVGFC